MSTTIWVKIPNSVYEAAEFMDARDVAGTLEGFRYSGRTPQPVVEEGVIRVVHEYAPNGDTVRWDDYRAATEAELVGLAVADFYQTGAPPAHQ